MIFGKIINSAPYLTPKNVLVQRDFHKFTDATDLRMSIIYFLISYESNY